MVQWGLLHLLLRESLEYLEYPVILLHLANLVFLVVRQMGRLHLVDQLDLLHPENQLDLLHQLALLAQSVLLALLDL